MITPDDIHDVAFTKPPIGKRGYHEDQVDAFLEEAERTLAQGRPLRELVDRARFTKPPLGKRGYHEDEVDAFLELLAQAVPPAPSAPGAGGPTRAGGLTATDVHNEVEPPFVARRGFLARLTGRP